MITINNTYWLYTGLNYWTITPYCYDSWGAYFFSVYSGGDLGGPYIYQIYGVRPVINLKADTVFTTVSNTNKGTKDNPYIVS